MNAIFALHFDRVAQAMLLMIGMLALGIGLFSRRFLRGDRDYIHFFARFILLTVSLFFLVAGDSFLLYLMAWAASHTLLVRLMIHCPQWEAASRSGFLAAKTFFLGFCFLIVGFGILFFLTGESTFQGILLMPSNDSWLFSIGLLSIVLGAMVQSALWPFHRWLLSSLNSPTPVSALMHAGLVNGGGLLLIRLAPLYLRNPLLLLCIFLIGSLSVCIGSIWKFLQNDVKRMLACSTMGQLGFMFLQSGLGLFPAACTHLMWHGFFKAYLFLYSGNSAKEKPLKEEPSLSFFEWALAVLCGIGAGFGFSFSTGYSLLPTDSHWILTVITSLAAIETAFSLLTIFSRERIIFLFLLLTSIGWVYGYSVRFMQEIFSPIPSAPQPIHFLHFFVLGLFITLWIAMRVVRRIEPTRWPDWLLKLYVMGWNASQPDPQTVTAHRNAYAYKRIQ